MIPEDRLYFILEEVRCTERLPELSNAEEAELVGRTKLVWDWGHPYAQQLYWLTEAGLARLSELREWIADRQTQKV